MRPVDAGVDRPIVSTVIPLHRLATASLRRQEDALKHGARNDLVATVRSVQRGDVMTLVKLDVKAPARMASVITTESADELELEVGDTVHLIVKAIHVLPVKE
jgi:molybdate transport system regulatory protein